MSRKKRKKTAERNLFSERFHNLRKELKLSQRDFAKKLGFTANTQISKIENAESEPSLEILRKIADLRHPGTLYQIDIHELVTGKQSPKFEALKEEYKTILKTLSRYISRETARLLDERHRLWGELGSIREKESQGIKQPDYITFLESELSRIEKEIADIAHDKKYVDEQLLSYT